MVKKIVLSLLISINVNAAQTNVNNAKSIYTNDFNKCMNIAKGIEGHLQCDLSVDNRATIIKTYIRSVGINEFAEQELRINLLHDTICLGYEQGIYSCSPQGIKE